MCVCVCVVEDKKKCVVFPSFCKEQNNLNKQKKKKIFVRCWNKKYEEKLAHAFLHLLYNALLYYTNNNNVSNVTHKNTHTLRTHTVVVL